MKDTNCVREGGEKKFRRAEETERVSQLTTQRDSSEHIVVCVKEMKGRVIIKRRADTNNDLHTVLGV